MRQNTNAYVILDGELRGNSMRRGSGMSQNKPSRNGRGFMWLRIRGISGGLL
jgi:hypothetical protein